jgi:acetolactate synthase II small subunit
VATGATGKIQPRNAAGNNLKEKSMSQLNHLEVASLSDQLNNYSLNIVCQHQTASLERLLRVVRFRGFTVQKINAVLDEKTQTFNIAMTVASKRPVALLTKQLLKKIELVKVDVLTSTNID